MLKQRKQQVFLAIGAGVAAVALGAGLSVLQVSQFSSGFPFFGQWIEDSDSAALDLSQDVDSAVLSLISLTPAERTAQLEQIATGEASLDRLRARYLLATDALQQGDSEGAIAWLDNLDQDYEALAPQILVKRAQAYEAAGNSEEAIATWQQLLDGYPEHPIRTEALFALGKSDRTYWQQALEQFPAHPRSVEIAQTLLSEDPNQLPLLLILARHGHYLEDFVAVLDRLTNEYASQLQPEDWEAIAFGYWEKQYYGSAGTAYAKAPRTPVNAYRAGRGMQLGERPRDALAAYYQLTQEFPDSDEAPTGLLRMADLAATPEDALRYLDLVIETFPDHAAEALLARADVLEELQSGQSANQARQSVLSQHSDSESAAELRWSRAERQAAQGDLQAAWDWARQVVVENPDSEIAPEAAFWVGKWAEQMGEPEKATQAFEHVLKNYPESYYAWRSAAMLGWDVGSFTTVRDKIPQVSQPLRLPTPPAGSETLQELYRLGQRQDAWALWQVEFENVMQPTVSEQFTDGLMRLGVGDHLDGIFMVSSLAWREKPEEQDAYQALTEQPSYWQALYPFPFSAAIQSWSKQRQLNPVLVTALIRQESRFEPGIQSVVGATGLMQVMPETADWVAQQIGLQQYEIANPDDNLALGTWYLDYTHREYSNNSLFAVASYNAGPGNVADWINRFGFSDPDAFVEQIPFPETKGYVESVFENYWNYLRLYNPEISQQLASYTDRHPHMVVELP